MFQSIQHRAPGGYQFGDSDIAALRLSTVARVFAPSSARFLQSWIPPDGGLVVDLGCGPGHSTRLLARVFRDCRVVGLDASARFLAQARESLESSDDDDERQEREHQDIRQRTDYLQHDVTWTPFPVPPANVLYARFLLSHVTDPQPLVSRWLDELAPGGVLLLDEVDNVDPEHPVAANYQDVVESMLRNKGQRLDVGQLLGRLGDLAGAVVREQRVVAVRPTSREVGRMFSLNLRVWRDDPFVASHFGVDRLTRLQADLDAAAAGEFELPVVWTMRQMALGR